MAHQPGIKRETSAIGSQPPIRVLLIAYQCEPDSGSVAMIGWHWFRYLRRHVEVHLVTHIRHKARLDSFLDTADRVTYIDTERLAGPLFRLSTRLLGRSQHALFMVSNLDFLFFGFKLSRWCRRERIARDFDLCHLVTPVSAVAPHRFGRLGLPLVIGPLNSGLQTPKGFESLMRVERAWLFRLRGLGRLLTGLMGTFRHAAWIFSASKAADRALGPRFAGIVSRLCENGVHQVAARVAPFPEGQTLRLIFVGRIIAAKGLAMLLEAMARCGDAPIHLTLVGEGPERAHLERLVESLSLADRVTFVGYQPPAALDDFYIASHINLLPSVRESGGATIIEAMALGRPSIALDHGGPGEYITPQCGILIKCESEAQVIADLAQTLASLASDPSPLARMGSACLERARQTFLWPVKIEAALAIYQRVSKPLEARASSKAKPDSHS